MGVVLPPLMHRKIVSEGGLTVRGLGRAAPTYGETCPGCDELLAGKRLSMPIDRRPINVTLEICSTPKPCNDESHETDRGSRWPSRSPRSPAHSFRSSPHPPPPRIRPGSSAATRSLWG